MRERAIPYLLLAPSAVFLLVLFVWPLAEAIIIAFTDGAGIWSLQNFREMADDLNFGDAVKNTVLLVIVVVPLQLVLALALVYFGYHGIHGGPGRAGGDVSWAAVAATSISMCGPSHSASPISPPA